MTATGKATIKVFLVATGLMLSGVCAAQAEMLSVDAACAILRNAALKHHFAIETSPPGKYVCENSPEMNTTDFIVFGLHYYFTPPPDWKGGSNLVGWYAVHRQDGKIFDWDVGEMRLGKRLPD